MANGSTRNLLPYGLGLALLAAAAHLGWEATHGGVRSHHLLARADMPAISNWWGLVILPALGWCASRTASVRAKANPGAVANAVVALLGSAVVGAGMSVSFAAGYESATSILFLAAVTAGLVLPTYRAEYAFGFVLGMVHVFGSAIPMIAVSVAAGISAAAHFLVRPAFIALLRRARG